jgi:hypothetical protein
MWCHVLIMVQCEVVQLGVSNRSLDNVTHLPAALEDEGAEDEEEAGADREGRVGAPILTGPCPS